MFHKGLTGKDLHAPSRETVINNTVSTISKLKVVYISGMGAVYPEIAPANPNLYQNFGVVVEDILPGQPGQITCIGFMQGLNTSAWPPNTYLFSDTAGNLSTLALGFPVAQVIKQHATTGVIYVTALSDQLMPPPSSDWGLSGNPISLGSFLGTTNAQALVIKTNSIQRAVFDINGRFGLGQSAPTRHVELKGHTSVDSSGLQIESFSVATASTAYQQMYALTLSDPQMVTFEISIQGKDTVTGDRCSFKRTGAFFRDASNVQLLGQGWQSNFTAKTNTYMNVRYTLGITDINIEVRGTNTTNLTMWTGYISIQELFL